MAALDCPARMHPPLARTHLTLGSRPHVAGVLGLSTMVRLFEIRIAAKRELKLHAGRAAVFLILVLLCSSMAVAYSVLSHEEIVDLVWIDHFKPLLLARYPGLTEEQLDEAHAYAYGGSIVQDLGYYPFGSTTFSNLLHYVRSGDFVRELIAQSQDANEYAFALGALSHYISDVAGHPYINHSVAIEFPKLRAKYGESVRYAQGKTAHLRTEFGFDTVQVGKRRYAPKQYHDFIGFKVSKPLLERVFPIVYGMELKDALPREDLAIGTFRWSVSQFIPELTKAAVKSQKHKQAQIQEKQDAEQRLFVYRLSRTAYEKEWGKSYQRAGVGARVLAFLIKIAPKIGPLKKLALKMPNTETEELYIKSINDTIERYQALLAEAGTGQLVLTNYDLDSGEPVRAAEYSLTDDTYAKLLTKLCQNNFAQASPELRQNILEYYSDLSLPFHTKRDPKNWQEVLAALDRLKSLTTEPPIQARTAPQ